MSTTGVRALSVIGMSLALNLAVVAQGSGIGSTELASASDSGVVGNGQSSLPTISADGNMVGFVSSANNLGPADGNNEVDAYVKNRLTGEVTLVSAKADGTPGNFSSFGPVSLSANGKFVVFASHATNLDPIDTTLASDIYVRDMTTGAIECVSKSTSGNVGNIGSYSPTISGDGRYVCFASSANDLDPNDVNGLDDIFIHDRRLRTTRRISAGPLGGPANGHSLAPAISADGKSVVFLSLATNLGPADTNGVGDIYVRNLVTKTTSLVSKADAPANNWSYRPSISADGTRVAFSSDASNLVADDTNGFMDGFVANVTDGTVTRVTLNHRDHQILRPSDFLSISGNGRFVSFSSRGSRIVENDTNGTWDIFVRDLQNGKTKRASVSSTGSEAEKPSYRSALSFTGRFTAFETDAAGLAGFDTNGERDVLVHDRGATIQP